MDRPSPSPLLVPVRPCVSGRVVRWSTGNGRSWGTGTVTPRITRYPSRHHQAADAFIPPCRQRAGFRVGGARGRPRRGEADISLSQERLTPERPGPNHSLRSCGRHVTWHGGGSEARLSASWWSSSSRSSRSSPWRRWWLRTRRIVSSSTSATSLAHLPEALHPRRAAARGRKSMSARGVHGGPKWHAVRRHAGSGGG